MLELTVHMSDEAFNEETQEFFFDASMDVTLQLEHSLVSLSKWESIYEKPFLAPETMSTEEVIGYVKCMILTPDYPLDVFNFIDEENIKQINAYIDAKMTATWFAEERNTPRSRKTITSELIYYWIVSYQIPWDVEHWHLNRLFTLIKVFNAENDTEKNKRKKSGAEAAAERQALNEQRRAKHGTSG